MPTKIPTSRLEAARSDARALHNLSTSLSDFASLYRAELPTRVVEAIEQAHAEVLRASHLTSTACSAALHEARKP